VAQLARASPLAVLPEILREVLAMAAAYFMARSCLGVRLSLGDVPSVRVVAESRLGGSHIVRCFFSIPLPITHVLLFEAMLITMAAQVVPYLWGLKLSLSYARQGERSRVNGVKVAT
jgi:hypothetical protein